MFTVDGSCNEELIEQFQADLNEDMGNLKRHYEETFKEFNIIKGHIKCAQPAIMRRFRNQARQLLLGILKDFHREMFEELRRDASFATFRSNTLPRLCQYLKLNSRLVLTSISDGLAHEW